MCIKYGHFCNNYGTRMEVTWSFDLKLVRIWALFTYDLVVDTSALLLKYTQYLCRFLI